MNFLELFRKATPQEKQAVLQELEAARTAKPPRPEMAEDERRAIGAEYTKRYSSFLAEGPRIKAATEDALKRRHAIDVELARLGGEESGRYSAWTEWRDPVMAQLWRERPALVDQLVAKCEAEALEVAQGVSRYELASEWEGRVASARQGEIVSEAGSMAGMARTITNGASCAVRRKALLDLAGSVRDWTARGEYATTGELQQKFEKAYTALPRVQALRDVMATDVRGRQLIQRGVQYVEGSRPLPRPAA